MPRHARRLWAAFLPLLSLVGACSIGPSVASAATPSLFWSGVKSVSVVCLVQTRIASAQDMTGTLCKRVRELASSGAPGPVRIIELGDKALVAPDNVTLLVHASVDEAPGGRAVAFTIRPYRALGGQDEILFGSSPRIAAVDGRTTGASLDAALTAALAETVPWRAPAEPVGRPLYSRPN